MKKATVKNIRLSKDYKQIEVTIDAQDSIYIEPANGYGFPTFMNSAPLVEGFSHVLEFGHIAVQALKGDKNYTELIQENRKLRQNILHSDLAIRVKQFLSALDYTQLTDFQAKCVLLLENELKPNKITD